MSQSPFRSSERWKEVVTGRGPLVVALGAIVVGLLLLCVFALLLVRDFQDGTPDQAGQPTPFPSPIQLGVEDVIIEGISGSTAISLTVNVPTALRLAGEQFTVRPEPIEEDGTWEPEVTEDRTALWVYGTLINYIIGLPDNDENRTLLENLAAGDEIQLTMRDGSPFTFAVTNREYVSQNRTDVFEQNMPGVTLILLRARGDERLVVQGDYVVDTSLDGENGGTSGEVALGETAQLDQMRLTVTDATALFDRPEAPPGFVFYVIDLQVENVGTAPIDLSNLRFVLRDDLGNQYALNPQATQLGLGTYSPPTGILPPGEMQQVSIAYQIPAGLTSPTLTLLVSREGGTGQIQVTIPFTAGAEEAAQAATVSLQTAEVSEDGTSIILMGQITNSGSQSLVVEETDVALASNGTVHLMLSTNPAFPWVVPAGQSIAFSVTFQRPAGREAIFTILNRPFQLSGLR